MVGARTLGALMAAVLVSPVLTSCGDDPKSAADKLEGSITVLAASSLTGTFTALAKQFEADHPGTKISFEFGSSADLATSIVEGATADLFAAASTKSMDAVIAGGEATDSEVFATNTAEIAVAPGNPTHITGLADLAKPGTSVALCVVTAPCGVLAQTILTTAGVALTPKVSAPDVKSTLAVVQSGDVDAGIVYVTDVLAAAGAVDGVTIPDAQNSVTSYPIAALTHSANRNIADAFVKLVTSSVGQAALKAAGFGAPPAS